MSEEIKSSDCENRSENFMIFTWRKIFDGLTEAVKTLEPEKENLYRN